MVTYNQFSQTRRGFLSGNMLKGIAAVTMTVDHLAAVVVKGYVSAEMAALSGARLMQWNIVYIWMRRIGRTAFPLFAFLLVEGFFHTSSRNRYCLRLFLSALLSEIPYNLAMFGKVWCPERQNVLFTLFLSVVLMEAAEKIGYAAGRWRKGKGRRPSTRIAVLPQFVVFALGGGLAHLCRLDYSYKGVVLAAVFWLFHQYRVSAAVCGFCVFSWNPWSLPAFLLLPFYSGEKGRGRKRWFYLFYPVHLFVLYAILRVIDFCRLS